MNKEQPMTQPHQYSPYDVNTMEGRACRHCDHAATNPVHVLLPPPDLVKHVRTALGAVYQWSDEARRDGRSGHPTTRITLDALEPVAIFAAFGLHVMELWQRVAEEQRYNRTLAAHQMPRTEVQAELIRLEAMIEALGQASKGETE
jgi:hypothetical protein